ncbi:hypothetical protein [Streptomyces sp. NPDC056323]|uniref:nSTAND1 domain-containing NTPase n=1 Tax=Streptomyces sp. NPDC056323 TaxID=3345784 RepID=UPI0035DDC6FC
MGCDSKRACRNGSSRTRARSPARMPLVQFALTEPWRRRSRAMLTHAAYDDLGGVAGTLAGYADDAYEALSKSERSLARRLFVQLARPGDGDTFTRRPTRTADLAPELVALTASWHAASS